MFRALRLLHKGSEATVKALGMSRKRFVSSTALLRCSGCKLAYFCGKECQKSAWKKHKVSCLKSKEGLVACVEMTDFPSGTSPRMEQVFHPISYLQQLRSSFPSPVMALIGVPLMLSPLKAGSGNQWCTYMMAEPESGFAPMQFQDMGKCLLWRKDMMPITDDHVEVLGDFFCDLMDRYGDEPGPVVAATCATKKHFASFVFDGVTMTREDTGELVDDCRGTAW